MRTLDALEDLNWDRAAPALLIALALAQFFVQTAFSTGLGADDAQLLLWSQRPIFGAIDQPTLLSNTAWALSKLGLSPEAFARIARQVFIVAAMLLVHAALRRWTSDSVAAWLGALAIGLLPDAHRNGLTGLTHTPFMIFALALAFWSAVRCSERPTWGAYVALGFAFGLVPHAKYNASIFVLVFVLLAAVDPWARRVVWNAKFLATAAIFALMVVPPALWGLSNPDAVGVVGGKLRFGRADIGPIWELISAAMDSAKYMIVLGLFAAAFWFRPAWRERAPAGVIARERLATLARYCLIFFALAAVAAMVADVGVVKRRWVAPGTLFLMVLCALWAASRLTRPARSLLLAVLAAFWAIGNVKETWGELSMFSDKPRPIRVDNTALAEAVAPILAPGDLVIGPRILVADVVRRFPGVTGWAGEAALPEVDGRTYAVWTEKSGAPDELIEAIARKRGGPERVELRQVLDLKAAQPRYPAAVDVYHMAEIAQAQP